MCIGTEFLSSDRTENQFDKWVAGTYAGPAVHRFRLALSLGQNRSSVMLLRFLCARFSLLVGST